MSVKASPEAIREMKKEIMKTISDIQRINNGIRSGLAATSGWDDAQAQRFNALMQRIAGLTTQPVETLNGALPKLEKLAQSLDRYNNVKF